MGSSQRNLSALRKSSPVTNQPNLGNKTSVQTKLLANMKLCSHHYSGIGIFQTEFKLTRAEKQKQIILGKLYSRAFVYTNTNSFETRYDYDSAGNLEPSPFPRVSIF